jgi:hypothetical protein
MKYYYILSLTFLFALLTSCEKNEKSHTTANISDTFAITYRSPEWMKLDTSWIPVITPVDSLLYQALSAYKKKDLDKSRENLTKASSLLEHHAKQNQPARLILVKSSESLKELSADLDDDTSMFEMDSIFLMVCDVSRKHCWDLIGDDIWIPTEEIRTQLNLAEKHIQERDSAKAAESLQKSIIMIELQNDRFCSEKGKKPLMRAKDELHMLYHKILKGEEIPHHMLVSSLGRTYFSIAEQHYFNISLNMDKLNSKHLGKEIYHCALYLQKAIKIENRNVIPEQESLKLLDAQLMGKELYAGYEYDKEEIEETVKKLGLMIHNYEHAFLRKKYL